MQDWSRSKLDVGTCVIASPPAKLNLTYVHTLCALHTLGLLLSQNAHLEVVYLTAQRSE